MTMERNQAADMGYDDPIHNSYEDTCRMYDQVADTMLHLASRTPAEVMLALIMKISQTCCSKVFLKSV